MDISPECLKIGELLMTDLYGKAVKVAQAVGNVPYRHKIGLDEAQRETEFMLRRLDRLKEEQYLDEKAYSQLKAIVEDVRGHLPTFILPEATATDIHEMIKSSTISAADLVSKSLEVTFSKVVECECGK